MTKSEVTRLKKEYISIRKDWLDIVTEGRDGNTSDAVEMVLKLTHYIELLTTIEYLYFMPCET